MGSSSPETSSKFPQSKNALPIWSDGLRHCHALHTAHEAQGAQTWGAQAFREGLINFGGVHYVLFLPWWVPSSACFCICCHHNRWFFQRRVGLFEWNVKLHGCMLNKKLSRSFEELNKAPRIDQTFDKSHFWVPIWFSKVSFAAFFWRLHWDSSDLKFNLLWRLWKVRNWWTGCNNENAQKNVFSKVYKIFKTT